MIRQHVIVRGLPAPSHLDDSYIFVCLLTRRHGWARSPTGLALPGKRVAYCAQQDCSYVGLLGRGIWPAWISSAGWNRGIPTGGDWQRVEDRVHQSLLSTRIPEKLEKELLRIMVRLVHTPAHNTHQWNMKLPPPFAIATFIATIRHIRFHNSFWNSLVLFCTLLIISFHVLTARTCEYSFRCP